MHIEREALIAKARTFPLGQGQQWTGGGRPKFVSLDAVINAPAADVYTEEDVRNAYTDGYSTGMAQGMEKSVVPELRKTVELLHKEYERAKRLEFVRDPLAYAVYQVWKAVDGRRKNGR